MFCIGFVGTFSRVGQHVVDPSILESFLSPGQPSRGQLILTETHRQTGLVLPEQRFAFIY